MSQEYDNTNRGALFKNDRKQTENQPDYTGHINVDGVEFWLSAWLKKSGKGVPFMSVSVRPKEERQTPARIAKPQTKPAPSTDDEFTDDIPF